MTRPAQPRDYGPQATQQPVRRQTVRREYRDALGRPLVGQAIIRNEADFSFRVAITNGVLEVELLPGTYRIMTALAAPGATPVNQAETVKVAKYR